MKKKLAHVIVGVLIFMIAATVSMCIFWMPDLCSYLCGILAPVISGITAEILFYTVCMLITLPLVFVFSSAFCFVSAIKHDNIFTVKCAKRLKMIGTVLFCDCALFMSVAIAFIFLGEKTLCPALAFIGAIGIMISLMLYALSSYVKDAAILKEEADCTL